MNYTKNYHLSQWDAADRVLREDFNRDNETIDAALAAVPYAKIKEVLVHTPTAAVDLDVSDVDFSRYLKIELFLQCPEYRDSISVQVNHLTSGYCYGGTSGGSSGSTNTTGALASFRQYGYGVLLFYTPTCRERLVVLPSRPTAPILFPVSSASHPSPGRNCTHSIFQFIKRRFPSERILPCSA